jgi:hypothetical protein
MPWQAGASARHHHPAVRATYSVSMATLVEPCRPPPESLKQTGGF